MKRTCPVCGFLKKQAVCECCRRLRQWERKPTEKRLHMFPPLIRNNLTTLPLPKVRQFQSSFIFGPAGTGKTTLACNIVYQLMRKSIAEHTKFPKILFIPVPNLLAEIKSTYDKNNLVTEHEVLSKYMQCDWLVLDDLGAEDKATEWTYQILYLIINTRYLQALPMIITSNLNLEQIARHWNDNRLAHRIMETCKLIEKKKTTRNSHYDRT